MLLRAGWGYTVETATLAIRMVLSGVFDKHPKLKIILGHLGETLPFLVWRVDTALARPGAAQEQSSFRDVFCNNFWITTSGNFSNPALLCCVMEMGIDRILFSVDYPFVLKPRRRLDRDHAAVRRGQGEAAERHREKPTAPLADRRTAHRRHSRLAVFAACLKICLRRAAMAASMRLECHLCFRDITRPERADRHPELVHAVVAERPVHRPCAHVPLRRSPIDQAGPGSRAASLSCLAARACRRVSVLRRTSSSLRLSLRPLRVRGAQ